jgi:hypothetical protein
MHKFLLLSEVASLASGFEWEALTYGNEMTPLPSITQYGMSRKRLEGFVLSTGDEEDTESQKSLAALQPTNSHRGLIIDPNGRDPMTGHMSQSQKMKIVELLGSWCVVWTGKYPWT